MGQGEAISVLCRAYILTNKSCYLESLKNAAIFLKKDIKYGGVMRADSEDVVFEEYASVNSEKISVLNGWIFTLFGLFDYIKLIPDLKYEKLLYASVLTLEKYLQCYDCGYWSMYDLSGRIASPAYHDLHIDLLYVMSDLTDIDSFSKYAEKWSKYKESNLNKFKAIVRKIGQKLLESSEGVVIQ